ncbi:TPA: adhesin, partial [Escherichia coli]|nr:adhesin [Escherichia coli]
MNKIFKVIWNPATGSYSVASETAKSRGKKSGRSKLLISALVAGGLLSPVGANASVSLDGGKSAEATPLSNDWIAIGKGAVASSEPKGSGTANTGSVAVGIGSTAGVGSTAIGFSSNSSGERSVGLGQSTVSTGSRAIAIGSAAKATSDFTVALGNSAQASGEGAMALGKDTVASAANALAFGRLSVASAANAVAIGAETEAAENATAVGTKAEANGLNSIALGYGSIANIDNTIALGNQSQAIAAGAIAIGQGNKADGVNAIALGNGSITGGANAIALGQGSYAGLENGIAIGAQATAQGKNSIALGAGSVATEADTVSVGNTTAQRKIVNMAKGDIDNNSTDAINGSQLYAISKSVADNLGGGATVNSQGVVTSPNYRLKNGIYGNVGDALADLNTNTIQWDSLKKGYSAAHGTDATSKITNVTAGDLSATSTDAVNGSQLKATKDDVAANTTNITNLTSEVAGNTTNITNLTDTVTDLSEDALKWDDAAGAFTAAHGTNATNKIT